MTINEGEYQERGAEPTDGASAAPMAIRATDTPSVRERETIAPIVRQRPDAPLALPQPGPRTSDTTGALFLAIAIAQASFGEVVKTRTADVRSAKGAYSYKYANLSDVMRAIDKPLRDNGLVPMQIPMGNKVYVRIVHGPSGEWIEGGLPLALPDYGSDIQRLGSALTYMRRYLLTMMLGIVADDAEDDDGAVAQTAARR